MLVKYLDKLDGIINKYKLRYDDICIVASAVLAYEDIRENHDLDICMKPQVRERFISKYVEEIEILPSGTVNITNGIQLLRNRYVKIGIDDNQLFCANYIEQRGSFFVVKLEVELVQKIRRAHEKDIIDLKRIGYNFYEKSNFDKELFKKLVYMSEGINKCKKNLAIAQEKRSFILPTEVEYIMSIGAVLHKGYGLNGYNRYDLLMICYLLDNKPKVDEVKELYKQVQDENKLSIICEAEGINTNPYIVLDENGMLGRVSMEFCQAIHHHEKYVKVKFSNGDKKIDYPIEQIINHNNNFAIAIEEYKKSLFKEYGVCFCAIIWGAAKSYIKDIKNRIEGEFFICEEKTISFQEESYIKFIKEIYTIDDVEAWKIFLKIEQLKKYENIVNVIIFEVPFPNFREKKRDRSYLSDTVTALKHEIREEYKSRVGCEKDIIIHIGDNHRHNSEMIKIAEKYERQV